MDAQSQTAGPDDWPVRADWMSVLAQAPEAEIAAHWQEFPDRPEFTWLKRPEHGSVSLQGRINGDGPRFHCGELSVTRCVIQLEDGRIGIAYVHGRSHEHAMMAAVLDALLQAQDANGRRARHILTALRICIAARRAEIVAKTEATRVNFTMTAIG